ncbi:MAG TPA: SpoIID/LytB domain-containing protein, partial [Abditibacteriaceae bacterium]
MRLQGSPRFSFSAIPAPAILVGATSLSLAAGLWFGFTPTRSQKTSATPSRLVADLPVSNGATAEVDTASHDNSHLPEASTSDDGADVQRYEQQNGEAIQAAFASLPASRERNIRVGLSTKGAPIVLLSRGTMFISDGGQGGRRMTIRAGDAVTFTLGANRTLQTRGQNFSGPIDVRVNDTTYGAWKMPRIWVAGGPTQVSSNGESPRYQRPYRGSFEIAPQTFSFEPATHRSNLRVVNIVPIEEYLKGVVPWEMEPSSPIEALKAQAICARSETLAKIESGRHRADGFDICDFDHCQGYPGVENEKPSTTLAVQQTSGFVIYYNGRIADAVYGTNSGGITAAKEDVWRGGAEPHLRSVGDFSTVKHRDTAQV